MTMTSSNLVIKRRNVEVFDRKGIPLQRARRARFLLGGRPSRLRSHARDMRKDCCSQKLYPSNMAKTLRLTIPQSVIVTSSSVARERIGDLLTLLSSHQNKR
jgi:hypothetical protein